MGELRWCFLGRVEFETARRIQTRLAERRAREEIEDLLLLLEHPAIFTIGKHAAWPELGAAQGVRVVRTDRGGNLTYHGPGQLVGYPVCSIRKRGVRRFVESIERALCDVAAALGVSASVRPGFPGVWIERDGELRKLASIGLAVRRGISLHGFALNADRRAEAGFGEVAPCGLTGVRPISLDEAAGTTASDLVALAPMVAQAFAANFEAPWQPAPIDVDDVRSAESG